MLRFDDPGERYKLIMTLGFWQRKGETLQFIKSFSSSHRSADHNSCFTGISNRSDRSSILVICCAYICSNLLISWLLKIIVLTFVLTLIDEMFTMMWALLNLLAASVEPRASQTIMEPVLTHLTRFLFVFINPYQELGPISCFRIFEMGYAFGWGWSTFGAGWGYLIHFKNGLEMGWASTHRDTLFNLTHFGWLDPTNLLATPNS